MHPDQNTPASHRYQSSDSAAGDAAPQPPDQDQAASPAPDADEEGAEVEEGARVAEAGNAYVGRQLDDRLKSAPRVEDGDAAVDEDPTTPGDD